MRYTSILIGSILLLASCNEVKMTGENDGNGVLSAGFRDTVVSVFENIGAGTLNVDFSQPLRRDTRIRLEVVEEKNMKEEKDYFLSAREITVAAGAQSAEVGYSLVDDNIANDARGFTLRLMAVNGGLVDSLRAQARVQVLDDESDAAVGFDQIRIVCPERMPGSSTASYRYEIPVKLFGNYHKPVQFQVVVRPITDANAAVENTHFRLLQTTFVLEDGATEINVPVEIYDNTEVNVDRVFSLEITEAVGAEIYTAQRRCAVIIENDDLGIFFGRAAMAVEERGGSVKVPVKLNKASNTDVSFTLSCAGSAVEGKDYSLQKEWTIPAGQDSIYVDVDVKHVAGISPDRVVELAFESLDAGLQVFDQGPTCEVSILDCDTKVGFDDESLKVENSTTTLKLPVTLESALEHDATFAVSVTPGAGMTATDAVAATAQVTVPAGTTTATVNINLKKLILRNRAYFDVKITEAAGATVGTATCHIDQYFLFQSSDFAIASYSTQETTGEGANNGFATAAIDGNQDTYWHSAWQSGESTLPGGIVIALPDRCHLYGIDLLRRLKTTNSDDKTAEFYLSNTLTDFNADGWGDSVGRMQWEKSTGDADLKNHLRSLKFDAPLSGKYLKVMITAGYRDNAQIAEVYTYGYIE